MRDAQSSDPGSPPAGDGIAIPASRRQRGKRARLSQLCGQMTKRTPQRCFKRPAPAVVFVTSSELRRQRFTRNIMEIPRGAGSGFIWDAASGLVVTNYHVVAGADRLTITMQDEETFQAEVVGYAPERDLAVLRLMAPPPSLTALPLGDFF